MRTSIPLGHSLSDVATGNTLSHVRSTRCVYPPAGSHDGGLHGLGASRRRHVRRAPHAARRLNQREPLVWARDGPPLHVHHGGSNTARMEASSFLSASQPARLADRHSSPERVSGFAARPERADWGTRAFPPAAARRRAPRTSPGCPPRRLGVALRCRYVTNDSRTGVPGVVPWQWCCRTSREAASARVASLRPTLNIDVMRDGAERDMWPVPKSAALTFTRAGSCCSSASAPPFFGLGPHCY